MLEAELVKRVEDLEKRVKELEELVKPKIIVVREVTKEEAKKLILNYIKSRRGEITSPLEISEKLQIPYEITHEIVIELIKEGYLEPYEGD
ncbi:hypothetical protein B6U96_13085 [Archaeoglobales archaeon ex4484_92]|nr:MAG: hypothetical protein B6U96_13085 [Archaeoglobales archaeon ex4484_92]